MKTFHKILILTMMAGLVLGSCKKNKDPEPSSADLQLQKLTSVYNTSGTKLWVVSSVTYEGIEDRTPDWSNFTISLATNGTGSNTYTTNNAFSPGPWPASGSWSFGGTTDAPNVNKIIRGEDGLEITIAVDATTLTMTFTFDETAHIGGRTEAVTGEYVFVMKAQ